MGWTLTIGNAVMEYEPDDLYLQIVAEGMEHPDAPDHDDTVGKRNYRSPAYTVWSEFCEDAGIFPLFYGSGWDQAGQHYIDCPDGFHRERPLLLDAGGGVAPLCRDDLTYVRAARIRRELTNGGRPPGMGSADMDSTLARLLWLEFWIDWALENCPIPILQSA